MDRAWFVARLAEIEQQIAESEGRIERLNGRLDDVRQRGTPLDVALARELLLTLKDSHALLLDHRDRRVVRRRGGPQPRRYLVLVNEFNRPQRVVGCLDESRDVRDDRARTRQRVRYLARVPDPLPLLQLRKLSRLDQVYQQIPFVLLQDGEIAGFADAYLISEDFHIGAGTAAGGAQCHSEILHRLHLLPLATVRCSMHGQTAAERFRPDRAARRRARS